MKSWIETDLIEKTESGTGETYLAPDFVGYETDSDMVYSVMDREDGTCLCRVAGSQSKVKDIEQAITPNPQTDDQARNIIQEHYPDSDLENVDVPDPGLDSMLEADGEDPTDVRSDIQIPTGGNQVLQDQELRVMEVVAGRKGQDISLHKRGIKRGKNDEHEIVMRKLRKS